MATEESKKILELLIKIDKRPRSIIRRRRNISAEERSILDNVTALDLSHNSLSSVPESIGELKNLSFLYLSDNSLSSVPESIGELKNLRFLSLSSNSLSSVPESIGELKNLSFLDLSDNSLSSVPENIGELKDLQGLGLSNLTLDYVPKKIADLGLDFKYQDWLYGAKTGIAIKGLQLAEQPIDMFLQNDRSLIEDWYRNHATGNTLVVNEAKVVFLGDGDVGKTYSIRRLMKDGEKETTENVEYFKTTMTHGIIIEKKTEHLDDGREVLLRYWDFGGQTIMHSMHRCFLTENTCYVIMISTRNDRDQMEQARYWLRNVESFAKNAPVIVMINQWGSLTDNIDKKRLMDEFTILKEIFVLNAKDADAEQFSVLRNTILKQIQQMNGFGEEWPVTWNNVRNEITRLAEEEKKYFLQEIDYTQICDKFHVDGEELQAGLLERFNWLGICFSYHRDQNKKVLSQYKVLNPEWLTNAIYLIIMNGQEHAVKGILPFGGVKSILKHPEDGESGEYLKGAKYDDEECKYVLEIMRKFGLSYETETGELIPVLCTEDQPENLIPDGWNKETPNEDHITYILRYQYKPDTIIQRLMVYCKRAGIPIEIWKNGMRICYPEFGLTMIVDAGKNEKDLIFDVYSIACLKGTKFGTHILLQLLLKQVNEINYELNMTPVAHLEVTGKTDKQEFEIQTLLEMAKDGMKYAYGRDGKYELRPLLMNAYGKSVLEEAEEQAKQRHGDLSVKDIETIALENAPVIIPNPRTGQPQFLMENPYTEKGVANNIYSALLKIQDNPNIWGRLENDFNTALAAILPDTYIKKDQTLGSFSSSKATLGSRDLVLCTHDNMPLALMEALRLSSLDTGNIKEHIDKSLKNYNMIGFPYIFIVVYGEIDKPDEFWKKLLGHLETYEFPDGFRVFTNEDGMKAEVLEDVYTNSSRVKMKLISKGKEISLYVYGIHIKK